MEIGSAQTICAPKRGADMRCPHLTKDVVYVCDSGSSSDVLETTTLRKYCKHVKFHSCPVYIASIKSVGIYYQLEPAA